MSNAHDLDAVAAILQTIGGSPVQRGGHVSRISKTELKLAFDALDRIQIALGECMSPLPTPESLYCKSCKGSGASAPDGSECDSCAGSGLRDGVTVRDIEEAYSRAPVESGTVSGERHDMERFEPSLELARKLIRNPKLALTLPGARSDSQILACALVAACDELAACAAPPLSPATPSAELIAAADALVDAAGIALGATATTQAREGLRVAIAAYDAARRAATAKGN